MSSLKTHRFAILSTYFETLKKPPTANEDDLAKHFAKFGLVDHVSVAKDKNGGDGHKGFAFITFQDKQVSLIEKNPLKIWFRIEKFHEKIEYFTFGQKTFT